MKPGINVPGGQSVPIIGASHLAAVRVPPNMLCALLTYSPERAMVCVAGVPPGALLRHIEIDQKDGTVVVLFEHPSFPLQQMNGGIAGIELTYHAHPSPTVDNPAEKPEPEMLEQ